MSAGFFFSSLSSSCHECGSHDANINTEHRVQYCRTTFSTPEYIFPMQSEKHLNFAGTQNANVIFRCCELYVRVCVCDSRGFRQSHRTRSHSASIRTIYMCIEFRVTRYCQRTIAACMQNGNDNNNTTYYTT